MCSLQPLWYWCVCRFGLMLWDTATFYFWASVHGSNHAVVERSNAFLFVNMQRILVFHVRNMHQNSKSIQVAKISFSFDMSVRFLWRHGRSAPFSGTQFLPMISHSVIFVNSNVRDWSNQQTIQSAYRSTCAMDSSEGGEQWRMLAHKDGFKSADNSLTAKNGEILSCGT